MLPLQTIQKSMEDNRLILRLYSEYINYHPRFLTAEMVNSLAEECHVDHHTAFCTLFSAACGLDTVENRYHRALEKQYILAGLCRLDPTLYKNDAYAKNVRIPEQTIGKWKLCTHSYAPYEVFVRTHPVLTKELREIPQLGYFDTEFTFPAVLENGIEWMTVTPNEIETMRQPIAESKGKVLTLGLGLGYFAFHASQKSNVTHLTVIERDPAVIELFKEHILPQFPNQDKIQIICSDAFAYMESKFKNEKFDFVFCDLWHDPSDGLDLYLRLKRYEKESPATCFSYWIEPSLLSLLRGMVFDKLTDTHAPVQLRGISPEELLSDAFLRTLDLKKI